MNALWVENVRQHDHDRYLAALLAPAEARDGLMALLGFNLEVAKVRELISEPLIGQIRLQWWRDAIDEIYAGKPPRRHDVVLALAQAIQRHGLTRTHLDALIDGREFDLADVPPADCAELERYAEATSSRLLFAALEVLDGMSPAAFEAARHVGIAWALTGLLRAIPFHAAAKRVYLPANLAASVDLHTGELFELRPTPQLFAVVGEILDLARRHLVSARAERTGIARAALPALLPARLADGYLKRIGRAGGNVFAPLVQAPDGLAVPKLAIALWFGRF
ncbi:MAG TPA: phytoene/squalene synthase family protein [Stellaceae bacterium]|nr:phytoene/squalene synthase family protein [Stellaceae bacterium]